MPTGPRKQKRKTVVDVKVPRGRRDSLDVFTLLREDVGAQNAEGWFSMPWRQGKWAQQLVRRLYMRTGRVPHDRTEAEECAYTVEAGWPEAYWLCERLRVELMHDNIPLNAQILLGMRLRMLQLEDSNSHGGGHGYNNVLLSGWHRLDLTPLGDIAGLVRLHRQCDVLGEDPDPRRAAAFDEAWRHGFFRAACAL